MSDENADELRIGVYRLGEGSPIDPLVAKFCLGKSMENGLADHPTNLAFDGARSRCTIS